MVLDSKEETIVILTEKQVGHLYNFLCEEKKSLLYKKLPCNIVIKSSPCGGVGNSVFIQTQTDYVLKKGYWKNITDLESW